MRTVAQAAAVVGGEQADRVSAEGVANQVEREPVVGEIVDQRREVALGPVDEAGLQGAERDGLGQGDAAVVDGVDLEAPARGVAGEAGVEALRDAGGTGDDPPAHGRTGGGVGQGGERGAVVGVEGAGDGGLDAALDRYLALPHARHPGHGCALPSLVSDVARGNEAVQGAFAEDLDAVDGALGDLLEDRELALGVLAAAIGGVSLARALPDDGRAEEVLAAVRRLVDAAVGGTAPEGGR